MNATLAVVNHTLDDIPLRIFYGENSKEQAIKYLQESSLEELMKDSEFWENGFKIDCTTPCSAAIVEFNEDGKPGTPMLVKLLGEEN